MKVVESPNATYEIHERYVISRVNEGKDLGEIEAEFILRLLKDNFDSDFGWIADRKNSYSTDPLFATNIFSGSKCLKLIAYVNYENPIKHKLSPLFGFVPSRIKTQSFDKMSDAVRWMEEQLAH